MNQKKTAYDLYLEHHGIKGQKWGVRRYQNPDGSLTADGEKRYSGERGHLRYQKDKAKYYEKSINDALKRDAGYLKERWLLKEANEYAQGQANKLSNKKKINQDKIDKFLNESNAMQKKMKEIEKDFEKNRKQIIDLVDQISKDNDVVYNTKTFYRNSGVLDKGYRKKLRDKYGVTPYYSKDSGVKSVNNDKFKVRAATERNLKKKKFTDDTYKRTYGPQYTRTYYYMY